MGVASAQSMFARGLRMQMSIPSVAQRQAPRFCCQWPAAPAGDIAAKVLDLTLEQRMPFEQIITSQLHAV